MVTVVCVADAGGDAGAILRFTDYTIMQPLIPVVMTLTAVDAAAAACVRACVRACVCRPFCDILTL